MVSVYLLRPLRKASAYSVVYRYGDADEYRQDPIPKSEYHSRMEGEEAEENPSANILEELEEDSTVRYWSDYSRVYYSSRSIQALPDPAEWEITAGNWTAGQESFQQFDQVCCACTYYNLTMHLTML